MTVLWITIGDFNQVVVVSEKQGGRGINSTQDARLQEVVDKCKWIDVGFQGPRFTWTNGRRGSMNIKERIDRAWSNLVQLKTFERAVVKHLPRVYSDHYPLLVGVCDKQQPSFKGFRFLEQWLHYITFGEVVQRCWKQKSSHLSEIMDSAKEGLMDQNKVEFGNIFQRKKKFQGRLIGKQKKLAIMRSKSLEKLEIKLMAELENILEQEE